MTRKFSFAVRSALVAGLGLLSSIPIHGNALAADCQCASQSADDTILAGDAGALGPYTLRFDSPVNAPGKFGASLCTPAANQVTRVRLWMPDMGHGSSPTQLVPQSDQCVRVEKVNFMMEGGWDIQVLFSDGTQSQVSLRI